MEEKHKKGIDLGLIIGIAGVLAGILLIIQKNYLIGISGSIASAGLVYISFQRRNTPKS